MHAVATVVLLPHSYVTDSADKAGDDSAGQACGERLHCESVPEQYSCAAMGCGRVVDVPRHVTPSQRIAGQGWWVAPPAGWLELVDADRGRLWVCSVECAAAVDEDHARSVVWADEDDLHPIEPLSVADVLAALRVMYPSEGKP